MPYVSARYGPPGPIPDPPGAARPILAIDDQGLEWSFREDSQVGDWLRYVNEGGTIDPADPVPESKLADPPRDLQAEIDELKARIAALEK